MYSRSTRKLSRLLLRTGEGTPVADILPTTREGGRGLRSVEMEPKVTKIKGIVRLYCNGDIQMVREFEERGEEMGRRSVVKEASGFAEELGVELHLEHPRKVKTELRKCRVEKLKEEVRSQRW